MFLFLSVQLLYVDSLNVSALNLDLPDGPFVVNVWSKANVDIVLDADLKRDLSGFGNSDASNIISIAFHNLLHSFVSFPCLISDECLQFYIVE